jgi:hypothetical protein
MTKFGEHSLDRTAALDLAVRNIGRLINLSDRKVALIGFTKRELKRRDVAPLLYGQQIEEVCTAGQPFWFQRRIWFEISDQLDETEWREFARRHREAWEARYGAQPAT